MASSSLLYLDNAATSFPKPEAVYQAQDHAARQCGASAGRGSALPARQAGQALLAVRETLARFFRIPVSDRLVFTANATQAINTALFGLLKPGDTVVSSSMEHNAVARPLYQLQQRGVQWIQVPADCQGRVAGAAVRRACLAHRPRLLVMNHCSNVTGTLQPIDELGPWCREQGIVFLVDAAQSAGVCPIDVQQMGIDLLAAPGHKGLLGPQGTGFLYVAEGIELQPLLYGGTGTASSQLEQPHCLPEALESGTLNLPALAGLQAGVDFICHTGLDQIIRHEQELLQQLWQGLQLLPAVQLFGPGPGQQTAVVSLTLQGFDPAEVGFVLDHQYGIAVRVGLHCAPLAHRTIGTYPAGTVRVSPGFFTTSADIDRFLAAMRQLASRL
ncbi:MAG: aminotransferase class V-fold PLP-dependent enzyme [Desulfuromonas thiophila]|nr:aminotransferase class V-fold PLP-dependent enzyme [Desulfuromonas thiophila]